jgi:hypothetical protein
MVDRPPDSVTVALAAGKLHDVLPAILLGKLAEHLPSAAAGGQLQFILAQAIIPGSEKGLDNFEDNKTSE